MRPPSPQPPIRTGPADRAGPAREHLRITARRDISGTAHLYRTGILTTGHHRRISIDGIAGGTLCLNGGAAQPGPTSELDCTDCYDAADRPLDANGWIIGNTLVHGDHVGLAVLADPAAHPST